MPFELEAVPALRFAAWTALLGLGLLVLVRRPDGAGRAFALWTVVWAGGIQMLLSLRDMATDAATQGLLYRVDYYAVLMCSSATAALVIYALRPRIARWAGPLVLAPGVLLALAFAANHGAFISESVANGAHAVQNSPLMAWGYHMVLWTGFTGAMAWLAWRAPTLAPPARPAAAWIMAGLALFAADRFARTFAWAVHNPQTLPAGIEGMVYALFTFGYGPLVVAMVLRARGLGTPVVGRAALAGALVGGTAILTYTLTGVGSPDAGPTTVGVILTALLAPAYGWLLARGVLAAPTAETVALARSDREAVLADARA